MKLAWINANWSHKWHAKGKKADYFAESLKLAHKGVNLRSTIITLTIFACSLSFALGCFLGAVLASI